MALLPDPMLLTFFRATNSFSAVALKAISSSYLGKRAERGIMTGQVSPEPPPHFTSEGDNTRDLPTQPDPWQPCWVLLRPLPGVVEGGPVSWGPADRKLTPLVDKGARDRWVG